MSGAQTTTIDLMASDNTARPLANFSDQQIVHEMLARFIVPNWFELEHIKERCLGEDAFNDLSKAQQEEVLAKVEHSMKENSRQCLDEYLDEMISMHIEEVKEGGEEPTSLTAKQMNMMYWIVDTTYRGEDVIERVGRARYDKYYPLYVLLKELKESKIFMKWLQKSRKSAEE